MKRLCMFEMQRSAGLKCYTPEKEGEFKRLLKSVGKRTSYGDNLKILMLIAMFTVDTKGTLGAVNILREKYSKVHLKRNTSGNFSSLKYHFFYSTLSRRRGEKQKTILSWFSNKIFFSSFFYFS